MKKKNFYFVFNEDGVSNRNYWILGNIEEISIEENAVNREKIDLKDYFSKFFENNTLGIFYIHLKINVGYLDQC